jgi:hypothetical protein|tara:strand:+ start:155 stop:367 length:213 start_codon:yes stop_codon:yes gene_type:complete
MNKEENIKRAIHESQYWGEWLEKQRSELSDNTAQMSGSEKYPIEAGGLSSLLQTAISKLNEIKKLLNDES